MRSLALPFFTLSGANNHERALQHGAHVQEQDTAQGSTGKI